MLKKVCLVILAIVLSACVAGKPTLNPNHQESEVVSVAVGNTHACAMTADQGLICWGGNEAGQQGSYSTSTSFPATRLALSSVKLVALSDGTTCVLKTNNSIWCFGSNTSSQLQMPLDISPHPAPILVNSLSGSVNQLVAGSGNFCALGSSGLSCWGSNTNGSDGHGAAPLIDSNPVSLVFGGTPNAVALRAYHGCAIVNNAIQCWGDNQTYQLGRNKATDIPADCTTCGILGPTLNSFGSFTPGLTEIGVGYDSSCAIVNGNISCWGYLPAGSGAGNAIPSTVVGISNATNIIMGQGFGCAISAGQVFCFGNNTSGQLGRYTSDETLIGQNASPVLDSTRQPLQNVQAVSAGLNNTACALTFDGHKHHLYCWGSNSTGQLGVSDSQIPCPSSTPHTATCAVRVPLPTN